MRLGNPSDQETKYVYIDGGAVRSAAEYFSPYFGGAPPEVQWKAVEGSSTRAFYYDALPVQPNKDENESDFALREERMRSKFEDLRKIPGFFVNYGVQFRRRKQLEQKRVDTMIAVDMLLHAQRKVVEHSILITNDQDFFPVVLAVMEFGVQVSLVCNPERTNDDFRYSTDRVSSLNLSRFHSWLSKKTREQYPLAQTGGISTDVAPRWGRGDYKIWRRMDGRWIVGGPCFVRNWSHMDLNQLLLFCKLNGPCDPVINDLQERVAVDGESALTS